MSNSFLNIPNLCVSGTPEKSSVVCPSFSLLQDDGNERPSKPILRGTSFPPIPWEKSEGLKPIIQPPPGFAPIPENSLTQLQTTKYIPTPNKNLKYFPPQNQNSSGFGFYRSLSGKVYPRSTPYHYMKYKHFTDRRRKAFQKSAYIIASIRVEQFKELGAVEYVKGIHIILRQYEPANSSKETCAIVALSKQWIRQLPYRFSNLYNILRSLPILNSIPGIQELGPYKLHVLKNLKYINSIDDNELILFNIEPKGQTTRSQHYYPTANLCLPGGGMETEDEFNWKKTAFREFEEETGFKLDETCVQLIDQQKWNGFDRESMYIVLKIEGQLPGADLNKK
jgi:hypothetical protein